MEEELESVLEEGRGGGPAIGKCCAGEDDLAGTGSVDPLKAASGWTWSREGELAGGEAVEGHTCQRWPGAGWGMINLMCGGAE